jgi:hypothetical protein
MHVWRNRRRVVERADTDETESRDSDPHRLHAKSSTAELSIVVVRSTAKCRPRAGGHESDQKRPAIITSPL